MKLNYDPATDSLYIHLTDSPAVDSNEVSDGVVLDYGDQGELVGIDVQHASQKADISHLPLRTLEAANDYLIDAFRDDKASVWVATCETLPGLVTEADTVEALLVKLKVIIPELLECNGCEIPFNLHTHRHDVARAA